MATGSLTRDEDRALAHRKATELLRLAAWCDAHWPEDAPVVRAAAERCRRKAEGRP